MQEAVNRRFYLLLNRFSSAIFARNSGREAQEITPVIDGELNYEVQVV
jgi:hypothetical protein